MNVSIIIGAMIALVVGIIVVPGLIIPALIIGGIIAVVIAAIYYLVPQLVESLRA